MFDISEEEFDSALGEICSNSDNEVDLLGGTKHCTACSQLCNYRKFGFLLLLYNLFLHYLNKSDKQ